MEIQCLKHFLYSHRKGVAGSADFASMTSMSVAELLLADVSSSLDTHSC